MGIASRMEIKKKSAQTSIPSNKIAPQRSFALSQNVDNDLTSESQSYHKNSVRSGFGFSFRNIPLFADEKAGDELTGVEYDFSQKPVHTVIQRSIQPKLKVSAPGDKYEQEADQASNQIDAKPGIHNLKSQIEPGSNLGKPLDIGTREEMGRKIGFDFSNVRIHTDDSAIYINKGLNARAFTHGSDIYFNEGGYNPNSLSGKKLLVHELAHVVQQSQMTDKAAQREIIQCTSIGQILDNFFSPFSSETLWIMPENDNYTRIVRRWQPVIDAIKKAKADIEVNYVDWSTKHLTDPAWKPGMTDPPVTDPNAYSHWVSSPLGTDPETCKNAFIVYTTTKATPYIPPIQTFELYTCSIGSFGIYATVDSIDSIAKTAKMNIWMYNAMDRDSFGIYASHPLFAISGMERQYMWWNWSESHSWGPPLTTTSTTSGGPGGGSSKW